MPIYEDPDEEQYTRTSKKAPKSDSNSRKSKSTRVDDGIAEDRFMRPFGEMDSFFSSSRSLFSSMMRDMERSFESMHTSMNSSSPSSQNVFYSSTTVTTSSNGVTETTKKVKDSRSGLERTTHARQIGDKYLAVDKVKDRQGRETVTKHLQNIREEEEPEFDDSWKQQASKLPQWRSRFHLDELPSHSNHSHNHIKAITSKK